MTGPDENVTAPAAPAKWRAPLPPSQDEPGEAGPGLPGWQPVPPPRGIPLPEPDAPPPRPPDDLAAAIADETETVPDHCERLLLTLEAKYVTTPTARYRRALAQLAAPEPPRA